MMIRCRFYDEVFEEFTKFGKIEDVQVCENLGEHMVGNVYVKFGDEVSCLITSIILDFALNISM